MTIEELKDRLKTEQPTFLTKAKKGYVCPRCGNGSGKDGTGIDRDPISGKYHCFKCELHEDIAGLYAALKGLDVTRDYPQIMGELAHYYGYNLDDESHSRRAKKPQISDFEETRERDLEEALNIDFSGFFEEAHKNINNTDYHRGLSAATLERFNIGYMKPWADPRPGKTAQLPEALIIPTGASSYIARNADKAADPKNKVRKVGESRLFNFDPAKLHASGAAFIVEGEIDAMSIEEAGFYCIGIGGTGNARKLLEAVTAEKEGVKRVFYVALDNDQAGQQAGLKLFQGLEEAGFYAVYLSNLYGNCKDANELLQKDPQELRQRIEETLKKDPPDIIELYKRQHSAQTYLVKTFFGDIWKAATPAIKTGFKELDEALDGGLYEGLYSIGAASSTGKTTFVLQIADQIAEQQQTDVLIFTLEQATGELIAKSISRNTYKLAKQKGLPESAPKTERGITDTARYQNYREEEKRLINDAESNYYGYADKIYIFEGVGDIGAEQVRAAVKRHIETTDRRPVVIVDYLQLLAPLDVRMSDKQAVDKNVLELKRLSRDYKLPIILISSINRANYKNAITLEAFKESGAIEFTSDIAIGLQYRGIEDGEDGENKRIRQENEQQDIKEIEAIILKNRHGRRGTRLLYKYRAMFNYFEEQPGAITFTKYAKEDPEEDPDY